MRHRVRIQPYISPDVRRKLAAYSAAQDVTESAVAEAALVEYLERDRGDEGPVLRRLDAVTLAVARLQDDLEVLAGTVGRFVRYSFCAATTPPSPEAVRQGDAVYRAFLGAVSSDLGKGVTFAGTVRRARAGQSSAEPGSTAKGGQ